MAVKRTKEIESTEPVQDAAPVVTDTKPAEDTGGFCVYLGPSITGVIQSGTIYPGSKAQALEKTAAAVDKYPLIAQLIVPGATLAEDRIKVKTPGNLLYVNYHKLVPGQTK